MNINKPWGMRISRWLVTLAVFVWSVACVVGLAEDVIITKSQQFRGKVKSANKTGVTIEIAGQGEMTVARASIVQMTVEPPPSVLRGLEAYEKGNIKEAQLSLAKVSTQYLGLDAPWAAKALVYYGRCCLIAGDYAGAEKAFNAFLSTYEEDHPMIMDAEIGLAETEVGLKNIDKALPKFQELAAQYDKQIKPTTEQLPYAAATFLGLGKCLETQDNAVDALNAYLKVIALYPVASAMPEALFRAAVIYRSRNNLEQAGLLLKDLTTQYSKSPWSAKGAALQSEIAPLVPAQQGQKNTPAPGP
ncbi:MAG: tetratricopeptide repeat protein [Kiritimatiellaeota bacterium]|nr:tetratricopeptide repeat protein [Kiritimatiellota bacterium]